VSADDRRRNALMEHVGHGYQTFWYRRMRLLGLDHRFLLARFFTLIEAVTLRVALYRASGLVLWHFPDLRRCPTQVRKMQQSGH
jgi:hypothetical protein